MNGKLVNPTFKVKPEEKGPDSFSHGRKLQEKSEWILLSKTADGASHPVKSLLFLSAYSKGDMKQQGRTELEHFPE